MGDQNREIILAIVQEGDWLEGKEKWESTWKRQKMERKIVEDDRKSGDLSIIHNVTATRVSDMKNSGTDAQREKGRLQTFLCELKLAQKVFLWSWETHKETPKDQDVRMMEGN